MYFNNSITFAMAQIVFNKLSRCALLLQLKFWRQNENFAAKFFLLQNDIKVPIYPSIRETFKYVGESKSRI